MPARKADERVAERFGAVASRASASMDRYVYELEAAALTASRLQQGNNLRTLRLDSFCYGFEGLRVRRDEVNLFSPEQPNAATGGFGVDD